MQFKISLSIEGSFFDPAAFDAMVPSDLKGFVKIREHLSKKSKNQRIYWESKIYNIQSGYPEDVLLKLLHAYEPSLSNLQIQGGVRISTQIVQNYRENESPRGVYISLSLVDVLSRLRADFDFDIELIF